MYRGTLKKIHEGTHKDVTVYVKCEKTHGERTGLGIEEPGNERRKVNARNHPGNRWRTCRATREEVRGNE